MTSDSWGRLRSVMAAVGLPLVAIVSCRAPQPESRVHQFSGPTMGSSYLVKVAADPLTPEGANEIERAVKAALDDVNARMSHYQADSEVSRINAWNESTPCPVSSATLEVLLHAEEISATTSGAFDITVGPLVDAWGFGPPGRAPEPPAAGEIAGLLERTGWEKLGVDRPSHSVTKSRPDLQLDLSAIAKGYAVDRVADALEALGLEDFMVEVGGEVRTRGVNPAAEPWQIGIERPLPGDGQAIDLIVPLSGLSIATSGDYRNYYEIAGKRISHTIDPRTGYPITHSVASVSVITPLCVRADAYATALLVLGPEGFDLAENLGLAAYFLQRDKEGVFVGRMTTAFKEILESGESVGDPER